MKNVFKHLTVAASIAAAASFTPSALATDYPDATGDEFTGNAHIDIASVEVSNDASDLIFKINLAGDPVATDWGKYMIGIDLDGGGATGDTAGDGWGRPISMSSGMDYWIGSWVDGGNGAEVYNYAGTWSLQNATYGTPGGLTISKDNSSVTLSYPFASLGLSIGSTIDFDVYSSGGGGTDTAIDALANPNQTVSGWGDAYDSGTNVVSYTLVQPIDPTNMVTFLVNMEAAIAEGDFQTGDQLWVRGAFNGNLNPDPTSNPDASNWELAQDVANTFGFGTNVYYGTFPITGFNGKQYGYRYWSIFTTRYDTGGYEYPMLSCGADRTLTITNEGASQTQPLDYFSDRSLADPTTPVTFSVDMSVQASVGNFTTNDTVYCRGKFNGWDLSFVLTNDSGGINPYLYSGTLEIPAPCGACFAYKFNYNEVNWENDPNREFNVDCTNSILPVAFFNNISSDCPYVTGDTNWVTFTVDLSEAIEISGGTPYDGTWDVYLNGEFLGWPNWNTNDLAAYQLTQVGGTSNYSITLPFPPGEELRMEYKYGADVADPNSLDKEAGFEQNHVRWIRTTPGETNYSVSDVWTGTNAQNIANLREAQLSLSVVQGTPGNVQIDWWGLHCASLQSAPNVTGPWTDVFSAAGVGSTNLPASIDAEYFRLFQP